MSTTHEHLTGLSPADKRALLARLLRERANSPRSGPLSFAQEQMWILDRLAPDSPRYNVPFALRLHGPLNVGALERSLNEIVRRHDILRATFSTINGRPTQMTAPSLTITVAVVDVREASPSEREARVVALVTEDARLPFDLARGPLLRASLFLLGAEEHVLLVNVHHIACDGWSMGILYRELATLYAAFAAGLPSPLPDLPIQYADFAAWQRAHLGDAALAERLAYWRQRLDGASRPGAGRASGSPAPPRAVVPGRDTRHATPGRADRSAQASRLY